ncbi:hypothetical protein Poli38472_010482 [Pythium oligandrum]|uniref:protein-tyrosine-phosphatase n=1 Tax=Pythium oligandrum TaxID=41045 RepID=A0A8K1C353_PYTOL|nr:hypothetical protein Poli38472_010482 [Pythium oligandrum]|eukprot:TMW55600.1 hypothetical protein Poli38472_010482 [Pythium oligandrum]
MTEEYEGDRYACKHCRRVLFTTEDMLDHEPERHQISTRRKLKDAKTKALKSAVVQMDGCSSWFLRDVLPWMDEDAMAEGKLKCPNEKCQSRVGSFSWSGSQCSCGTWVTPSIKLTKSRVDLILKTSLIPIVATVEEPTSIPAEATTTPSVSAQEEQSAAVVVEATTS